MPPEGVNGFERADYELLILELEGVARAAEITAEVFAGTAAGTWSEEWATQIRQVIANRRARVEGREN